MINLCLVSCDPDGAGELCDLPFSYNGTWHYGCITHDNDGTPWCDAGNGKKHNCTSDDCPGKLVSLSVIIMMTNLCLAECKTRPDQISKYGDLCVFPFYYKGTYHYECITHDNYGYPWCMIDDSGTKHECKSACPGNLVMTIQCNYNDDQPLFSIM